jgi:hypothetical protein
MKRNKLLVVGVLMLIALSVPTPIGAVCSYQIPDPGWVYMYSQAWYVPPCTPPPPAQNALSNITRTIMDTTFLFQGAVSVKAICISSYRVTSASRKGRAQ